MLYLAINPLRHLEVFSPYDYNLPTHVVGLGATGSKIAIELAKLGVENLHLYDYDIIEEHNVPNQAFGEDHIGRNKAEVAAEIIRNYTRTHCVVNKTALETGDQLSGVVFLLIDTMSGRKRIWDNGLKDNFLVELMIETRMAADMGIVYTLQPWNKKHIKAWESTLFDDKDDYVTACGASTTVGSTSSIISGLAVWQFIRWNQHRLDPKQIEPENEMIISTRPPGFSTRSFIGGKK